MIKLFANAWKVKDIRNKILYTFIILAIIRLGAHIALPGISVASIKAIQDSMSTGTLYNIIAAGTAIKRRRGRKEKNHFLYSLSYCCAFPYTGNRNNLKL